MGDNKKSSGAHSKEAFLANLGHELRTPLHGVLGLSEVLLQTELTPEQLDYVTLIRNSANDLISTVSDIIYFSKLEAHELKLKETKFTLQELFSSLKEEFAEEVEEKGLTLVFDIIGGDPGPLYADSAQFRNILHHLIGNALKFTNVGGIIVLAEILTPCEKEFPITFHVIDTGIGIESNLQNTIFDGFTQADNSTTRCYGGMGLGLSIARDLVQLLGGIIVLDSTLGMGSRFSFEVVIPLFSNQPPFEETAETQDDTEPRKTSKFILVADDQDSIQDLLSSILKNEGYEIHAVGNGVQVMNLIDQQHYDLLILDIEMPVLGGELTSQKIRERSVHSDLPILGMSAKEASADCQFDDFLGKPFRSTELLQKVDKLLGNK